MNKSENVIKGLHALQESMSKHQCYACSNEFVEVANEFGTNIIADAIELLERQEPKEIEVEGGGYSWWYVCPECHGQVDTGDSFCRHCGKPLKN